MPFITSDRPSFPSGGVTGPGPGAGTSTDNAIVRWDGTTGNVIQNSVAILDDSGNLSGLSSLTVTTLIATTTITTGDNLIVLNDDVVGVPTEDAGIEVNRGSSTDAQVLWDETNDYWAAGLVGSLAKVLLATDSTSLLPEGSNLYFTDERAQDAVGGILTDSAEIDFTYNDGVPSIEAALVATSVVAGSYGSATQVGSFTVDSKGRLTAASNTSIAIPSSQVTDFTEAAQDAAGAMLVDSESIDLTYTDATPALTAKIKGLGAAEYRNWSEYWDDFDGRGTAGTSVGNGWIGSLASTGGVGYEVATAIPAEFQGALSMFTGTGLSGASGISGSGGLNNLYGGLGALEFATRINLSALGTASNDYILRIGFMDSTTAAPGAGIWFEYNRGVDGNFWTANCAVSSSTTKTVTTEPVAATTWTLLRIVINDAWNEVKFYQDTTLLATITTNIPTGNLSGKIYRRAAMIQKQGSGSVNYFLWMDYWHDRIQMSAARG